MEDSEACNRHSEKEQKLLINFNEGDMSADIFLPSILESQTRHQAAYRPSIIMHTAGHSCFKLIAGTLGPWVTKPNLKKKKNDT